MRQIPINFFRLNLFFVHLFWNESSSRNYKFEQQNPIDKYKLYNNQEHRGNNLIKVMEHSLATVLVFIFSSFKQRMHCVVPNGIFTNWTLDGI